MRRIILLISFFVSLSALSAENSIQEKIKWYFVRELRQGDPLFVWAETGGVRFQGKLELLKADSKVVCTVDSFPCPLPEAPSLYGFALAVPCIEKAGTYTLWFKGSLDSRYFERAWDISVKERQFFEERIALTPDLTKLIDEPDPRKVKESEVYIGVLKSFDPAAIYMHDGFMLPTLDRKRSSGFGDRRTYIAAGGGGSSGFHAGIDFSTPTGTIVRAAGSGRVALAADRLLTGNTVIIEHLPGVYSIYMHMKEISVAVGHMVEQSQKIGTVGSTGFSTGPHLHWELRIGSIACDPEALMGVGPLDKVLRMIKMSRTTEGR